jgi:hypothetical protein
VDHDDAVTALGLAIYYASHGPEPRYLARDGKVYASREESGDPY